MGVFYRDSCRYWRQSPSVLYDSRSTNLLKATTYAKIHVPESVASFHTNIRFLKLARNESLRQYLGPIISLPQACFSLFVGGLAGRECRRAPRRNR